MNYTHHTRQRSIEPHGNRDLMDMEHHIHCLETKAYDSVLKAFIAQSDLLTWGKEGLLTELRKELNVTHVEHGEILMTISSDESVKWIREQRNPKSHAEDHVTVNNAKDYVTVNNPGCASASMGNSTIRLKIPSSAAFYLQKNMSHSQPSLTSFLIPLMPTVELAMCFHGKVEQSSGMINYNVQLPPVGRGTMLRGKHQLRKGFHPSDGVNLKNRSDVIQIHATDRVIHDVIHWLSLSHGGASGGGFSCVQMIHPMSGDIMESRRKLEEDKK